MNVAGLEIRHMEPSFAVGVYNERIVILCWVGKAKASDIQHAFDASQSVINKLKGEKTSSLSVADPRGGMPDEATRKISSEMVKKVAPHTACSAVVIEGDGFWASAVRAAVQGIHLVVRSEVKQHAFSNVPDAAKWLATFHAMGDPEVNGLIEAVRVLKER